MNPEEEALNFHLAVLKEYENIPTFATMGMNPWEDEELAAVRRLIRSERRAQRFIDTVPVLNSYIAEVVAKWPPERITLMMLARIAHYYATCTIFCAVWRARNALEAYLHDQKHLTSPLDVTADEILSADESERSILCSLKSLYNVLYQCPRDEFTNDFREQVAEHIESYLDIALAVADDPQVRRLRDYLRDFFAYDYQPVATRPLTQAEIDNLPELNFEELATLWKDAACSYAIAFANRNQDKELVKAIVVGVDEQVKDSALQSIKALFGRFFAKSKTGRVAFSRAALAKLCEVSERTIYNWDTGATAPEIDGYSEALRIGGGTEMFAWIEDYRRFKQRPQLGKVLTRKNIAFLDGITDKDKELIQEYIRTHRVA